VSNERGAEPAFDPIVIGDWNPDVLVVGGDVTPAFGQQEKLVDSMSLVAAIGADAAGTFMLAELAKAGVDTGSIPVRADVPTGMTVALSRGDNRAILTAPGAIGALTPADLPADLLARARHVHVSSYFLLEQSLGLCLAAALAGARAAGATTSLDTNWDPAGTWGTSTSRRCWRRPTCCCLTRQRQSGWPAPPRSPTPSPR
jgi:sugar/nucleoside kinase (ribokinase family)